MNGATNVQLTVISTMIVTIAVWLLRYFQPDLMGTAPPELVSTVTGGIAALVGVIFHHEAGVHHTGTGRGIR
jgi:hypothetical protein